MGAVDRQERRLVDAELGDGTDTAGVVDDLRQAVASFVTTYNDEWLIQRHGHQTPKEKFLASLSVEAA